MVTTRKKNYPYHIKSQAQIDSEEEPKDSYFIIKLCLSYIILILILFNINYCFNYIKDNILLKINKNYNVSMIKDTIIIFINYIIENFLNIFNILKKMFTKYYYL
jgi:hypothetical protein